MTLLLPERPCADAPAQTLDSLTRRGILGTGIGAAAVLGLAACGSDASPADSSTAGSTRKLDSANGVVEVPAHPTRIVTIDTYSMAAMFDLGMDPVGVYDAGEQYVEPQFLDRWKKIPKVSGGSVAGSIDVEKVAALSPDLIIGIDAMKPPYSQLKAIAPTVILSFSAAKAPWRDLAEATADAINLPRPMKKLESEYAARTAHIKTTYADVLAATRFDVIQGGFDKGQFWLYGPGSPSHDILADAGARFASASAGVKVQKPTSYEQIGKLSDADAIIYYATNDGKPANLAPALFAQPLWKRLPAVEKDALFGSIYFLPGCYSDALGLLDDFEKTLTKLGGRR